MVDLRADGARVAQLWNGSQASRVPLSVAAAFTYHQTRRDREQRLSRIEYANALDIAAAALSCLVCIYTQEGRAAISLARHRFRGGAAEAQGIDGAILAPLSVVRNEVLPALLKIERSGIEYLAPRRL
jgi:hypothetical protein